MGSLCGNNCPSGLLPAPLGPPGRNLGKSWNPGEKREIAEQTQTHRDSAWAQAVAYSSSKNCFFLVEVFFTGTFTLAGLEILEDHYGVGNVIAHTGDNGG